MSSRPSCILEERRGKNEEAHSPTYATGTFQMPSREHNMVIAHSRSSLLKN